MVSVPTRGGPMVAATANVTVAEPLPLAFAVIETQSTSAEAVHVQSGLDARRSTRPDPPL